MPRQRTRFGDPTEDEIDGITYDKAGRMVYHPDFHPNHGKRFTIEEEIYIAKFHGIDDLRTLSMALGRTEYTISNKVTRLREDGLYDIYRNLGVREWEARIR